MNHTYSMNVVSYPLLIFLLYFFSVARCVVPEIRVEPAFLDFQRCYLDLPYEQYVQLINSSNLPACYGVLDQVKIKFTETKWSELE